MYIGIHITTAISCPGYSRISLFSVKKWGKNRHTFFPPSPRDEEYRVSNCKILHQMSHLGWKLQDKITQNYYHLLKIWMDDSNLKHVIVEDGGRIKIRNCKSFKKYRRQCASYIDYAYFVSGNRQLCLITVSPARPWLGDKSDTFLSSCVATRRKGGLFFSPLKISTRGISLNTKMTQMSNICTPPPFLDENVNVFFLNFS